MRGVTGLSGNSWFNTQTVNFLGTLQATPDDRFTVKFINNNLDTRLPIRLIAQPVLSKSVPAGLRRRPAAAPGCGTVTLFNNGFNGSDGTDRKPPCRPALAANDRRTIVGGRWEHDFDNTTTWRNQFVFDDRNISQPTGATSAIGDFPSYNYMSDVTKRGEIFGLESTTYFGALLQHADRVERHAQRHAGRQRHARPAAEQYVQRHLQLRRSRARRTQADAEPDGGCRHRMGNDASEGDQYRLHITERRRMSERDDQLPIDRRPAIPEHRARTGAALQAESRVAVPGACRHRIRNAAGRQPLRPLERSERQQYAAQDADRTSVTTSASTGRRTTRSNSARPASTNSSATNW